MSVAAIIVLYNPNFEKLQRLYLSVCNQVSLIIFVLPLLPDIPAFQGPWQGSPCSPSRRPWAWAWASQASDPARPPAFL